MNFAIILALILGSGSAAAPGAPEPLHNGQDLNAACGAEHPDPRFGQCVFNATFVMMEFAEWRNGSDETGGDLKFCLPAGSQVSVENVEPLIGAYRAQYARDPRAFNIVSPVAAFLRAMRRAWPCAGGR